MKQSNPIININTKVFLKKGHWNSQKSEKQRKSKTDVYNLTKASKNLDSCKKCWHMTTSEKYQVKFKKVFFCFLEVFCMCASFKSIYSSCLSRKTNVRGNFIVIRCQRLRGQNTWVLIGLIEYTEPSDTLNYKTFFKHCVLQTTLHVFYCLYLWGTKIFCSEK